MNHPISFFDDHFFIFFLYMMYFSMSVSAWDWNFSEFFARRVPGLGPEAQLLSQLRHLPQLRGSQIPGISKGISWILWDGKVFFLSKISSGFPKSLQN